MGEEVWNHKDLCPPPECTIPVTVAHLTNEDLTTIKTLRGKLQTLKQHIEQHYKYLNIEWSLLCRFLYKNHSQFKMEKFYKLMDLVKKCIARYKSLDLEAYREKLDNCMPDINTLDEEDKVYFPSPRMFQYLLLRLWGAVELMVKTAIYCTEAFTYMGFQLKLGFFIPQMTVFSSIVSRIWILVQLIAQNLSTSYKQLYPVVLILKGPSLPVLAGHALPTDIDNVLQSYQETKLQNVQKENFALKGKLKSHMETLNELKTTVEEQLEKAIDGSGSSGKGPLGLFETADDTSFKTTETSENDLSLNQVNNVIALTAKHKESSNDLEEIESDLGVRIKRKKKDKSNETTKTKEKKKRGEGVLSKNKDNSNILESNKYAHIEKVLNHDKLSEHSESVIVIDEIESENSVDIPVSGFFIDRAGVEDSAMGENDIIGTESSAKTKNKKDKHRDTINKKETKKKNKDKLSKSTNKTDIESENVRSNDNMDNTRESIIDDIENVQITMNESRNSESVIEILDSSDSAELNNRDSDMSDAGFFIDRMGDENSRKRTPRKMNSRKVSESAGQEKVLYNEHISDKINIGNVQNIAETSHANVQSQQREQFSKVSSVAWTYSPVSGKRKMTKQYEILDSSSCNENGSPSIHTTIHGTRDESPSTKDAFKKSLLRKEDSSSGIKDVLQSKVKNVDSIDIVAGESTEIRKKKSKKNKKRKSDSAEEYATQSTSTVSVPKKKKAKLSNIEAQEENSKESASKTNPSTNDIREVFNVAVATRKSTKKKMKSMLCADVSHKNKELVDQKEHEISENNNQTTPIKKKKKKKSKSFNQSANESIVSMQNESTIGNDAKVKKKKKKKNTNNESVSESMGDNNTSFTGQPNKNVLCTQEMSKKEKKLRRKLAKQIALNEKLSTQMESLNELKAKTEERSKEKKHKKKLQSATEFEATGDLDESSEKRVKAKKRKFSADSDSSKSGKNKKMKQIEYTSPKKKKAKSPRKKNESPSKTKNMSSSIKHLVKSPNKRTYKRENKSP